MDARHPDLAAWARQLNQEAGPPVLEVQNWLLDMFLHVLPTEAAARLWDHVLESEGDGFMSHKTPVEPMAILSCQEEDLQEVFSKLPSRIEGRLAMADIAGATQGPEDVDILLDMDLADDAETEPLLGLGGNLPPVQVLKIQRAVKMPRRWQPWKFLTVAMVIPWLFMHATQFDKPNLAKQVAPPMLRKASLPPIETPLTPHSASHMTGAVRADQWLAAAAAVPKKLHRSDETDAETKAISPEIQQQVEMDMSRTARDKQNTKPL
eukprot:Skav220924  [mRNA]  locus=scaffold1145:351301:358998:+ [translate_table: standard]